MILNGRDEDALAATAADLEAGGLAVAQHACDVTDAAAVTAMVDRVETEIGPVEILVNNAGAQQRGPFLDFPADDFRSLLELNLIAPFVVAQAAGRSMAARGHGQLINVCSVQSQLGRPTIVPYTATKGGLKLMTRGLCADLGPAGIQVNAIAPGYFATELTQALVDDPEFSAWVEQRTPAGRWGDVEELGGAAMFLASDASSFVTGQIIYVDGGMTAVV